MTIEEANRTLIFQIPLGVCRTWHLDLREISHQNWLPRLHRAGPSTSLDKGELIA